MSAKSPIHIRKLVLQGINQEMAYSEAEAEPKAAEVIILHLPDRGLMWSLNCAQRAILAGQTTNAIGSPRLPRTLTELKPSLN